MAKGKWTRQCALLQAIKQVSRKIRPIELAACSYVGSPSSFGRSKTGRGLRRLHFLAEKALILAWICISGYRSVPRELTVELAAVHPSQRLVQDDAVLKIGAAQKRP